ncbi:OLC1v1015984C1 [Oldenlandia corymbosa var. corymbosa]|uniref:OLC1v1015984C1 n=1 Tax=Oldenlandia corymbosa var. corymbosa TaxID=529605 RepID=A0AAV1E6J9_OLDCO|nr:OLC1v1015984C1 [Oldenlandia corymbosa var. corymbosa]
MCDSASGNNGGTKFYCIYEGDDADLEEVITEAKVQQLVRDTLAGDRLLILYDYPIETVADDTTGDDVVSESDTDSSDGDWDERDSEYEERESGNEYDDDDDDLGGGEQGGATDKPSSSAAAGKQKPLINYKYDEGNYDEDSAFEVEPDSEKDLESLQSSDEDVAEKPLVFHPKDTEKPPLQCGLTFSSRQECKEAIRRWNIRRGRRWRFKKNDKRRIKAVGSPVVTTFVPRHKCKFRRKNKSVTSTIAGRVCTQLVKDDSTIPTKRFKRLAKEKYKFFLTKSQAYRARRVALRLMYGSVEDQYAKLRDVPKSLPQPANPKPTKLRGKKKIVAEPVKEKKKGKQNKKSGFQLIDEPLDDIQEEELFGEVVPPQYKVSYSHKRAEMLNVKKQEGISTLAMDMQNVKKQDGMVDWTSQTTCDTLVEMTAKDIARTDE